MRHITTLKITVAAALATCAAVCALSMGLTQVAYAAETNPSGSELSTSVTYNPSQKTQNNEKKSNESTIEKTSSTVNSESAVPLSTAASVTTASVSTRNAQQPSGSLSELTCVGCIPLSWLLIAGAVVSGLGIAGLILARSKLLRR